MIELIDSPAQINQNKAKQILIDSFIGEYSKPDLKLKPSDIGQGLLDWYGKHKSVEQYYEEYFADEFNSFVTGKTQYWFEAKIDGSLVGWSTFKIEETKANALYMNTLVVSPNIQRQGIGKKLTFSPLNFINTLKTESIHLLLRKKNDGGRSFYQKLGFFVDPNYQRKDNYVDINLLEGWSWLKNQA